MKTNPRDSERYRLALWLAERETDLLFEKPPAPQSHPGEFLYIRRVDAISPGDIYVLQPGKNQAQAQLWTPVYILVMQPAVRNKWLVVPFGRYASAAVPGEWSTGMTAVPLRVLCFWNARSVHADVFLPGAAHKLSAKKMQDVQIVYDFVMSGGDLSQSLSKGLGPPLVHPADPRYEYLEEERKRLDDHVERIRNEENSIITFESDSVRPASWLLAAEGRPQYGGGDK